MVKVNFVLYTDDGNFRDETRKTDQVSRIGDLITFDSNSSYQVVDVLWHLYAPNSANHRVTVTSFQCDWHARMGELTAKWRATAENRE